VMGRRRRRFVRTESWSENASVEVIDESWAGRRRATTPLLPGDRPTSARRLERSGSLSRNGDRRRPEKMTTARSPTEASVCVVTDG